MLLQAYLTNPDDYPGFFLCGGHTARVSLFTSISAQRTEPVLGLLGIRFFLGVFANSIVIQSANSKLIHPE